MRAHPCYPLLRLSRRPYAFPFPRLWGVAALFGITRTPVFFSILCAHRGLITDAFLFHHARAGPRVPTLTLSYFFDSKSVTTSSLTGWLTIMSFVGAALAGAGRVTPRREEGQRRKRLRRHWSRALLRPGRALEAGHQAAGTRAPCHGRLLIHPGTRCVSVRVRACARDACARALPVTS